MDGSRKASILMVVDDPTVARLISFCLERENFHVRHAADGEQALKEFATAQIPDLVFLDVMLPYHSGYALLANLRERTGWASVPVIMLITSDRDEDVDKALSAGADGCLAKPFSPAELAVRIRTLLCAVPETEQ